MENPVGDRASKRVILVGRIVFIWAVFIVGRLGYLQVLKHDEFVRAAKAQHQHRIQIPADRGEILDRTGIPLAISVRTESVVVNPQRVADPQFFSAIVAPALNLNSTELANKIAEYQDRGAKKARGRGFLVIKRHLTEDEKYRLQPLRRTLPIEILPDHQREYPNGLTGAHVIGSLDSEGNGNAGLEQKLNNEMQGKPGKMMVLTGSRQDSYVSWVSEESVQGTNLTLSIDRVIQHDAEEFLAEGVKEAAASSGTVIVMDPQTGEVLALANYPTFDPRHEQPTPEEAEARHKNIAVQIPCEPGSVMKMITVTMGIDSGRFTPSSGIFCENGSFARPGRRAIHDLHRMGNMDVAGILIKSSNIGVAKISIASGPKTLYDYLKRFGIGEKTGIELPAESRGLLRHLECKDSKDRWCWSPASHEYIAFGHEVGATAIQLARAVSVIANGGLLVNPHIVLKKSRPTDDGHIQNVPIEFKNPIRVIRPETAFTIRRIMESVVEEGTGRRAAIPGYSSGGKTGSAEIFENGAWQNRHNSSFIGFAPVTNPRVVVVVTLNRTPKQGGIAAAPIFSKVTETALRVLQVPKDRPESDIQPKPLTPAETDELPENRVAKAEALKKEKEKEKEELEKKKLQAADQEPEAKPFSPLLVGPKVPDFRGMAVVAVLRQSATLGLPVEIVGRGKARVQKPAPGTILSSGERIQVEFSAAQ
ncbi:penicillin-binding protein [Paludibaculum fermentans]|uniref:Transpeptidase family protein n=1 Tax=Paludibaculum fermentans TaxID=1473598 RepID=A0A7S7NXJ6_PALFE|nr:penicillin-binding protein [Paludibaculum fermentans]QOY91620.1 transpeptidase family protein [Paludibaculum fermentans]